MVSMFSRNDILIDQTLICESSRLFIQKKQSEKSQWDLVATGYAPISLERLLQLSILLDALALHDQLYILDGELTEDAASLELRSLLLQKDCVKILKSIPFQDAVVQEMQGFLVKVLAGTHWSGDFNSELKDRYLQSITNAIRTFLGAKTVGSHNDSLYAETVAAIEHLDEDFSLVYYLDEEKVDALRADALSFLGKRLVHGFGHTPTGGQPNTSEAPLLRTFLYWRISENAQLSLFTSPRRMGEIRLLTKQFHTIVESEVTLLLTSKFKKDVEFAYRSQKIPLVLPPTLALFLNYYRISHNLSTAIDEFRDLFSKTREVFRCAEEDLSLAKTIGDRLKIQQRMTKALEHLKTNFETNDDTYLEAALNYAPEVLKPLSNPLDPTKYSSALIAKPIEWVHNWWLSRPLRHVSKVVKRLSALQKYESLVYDALGISIKEEEHNRLIDSYQKYLEFRGTGAEE